MHFLTHNGVRIPAVTGDQMRQVDRLATDTFGLDLLQMMENAGRALASVVLRLRETTAGTVLVLVGKGGNGGGGLCAARHLRNHGLRVDVALAFPVESLSRTTRLQFDILHRDGLNPADNDVDRVFEGVSVVVDALVGYGLSGPPSGSLAHLISRTNDFPGPVVSLDIPSGVDATTGKVYGQAVVPTHTVTLALPKTGLREQPGLLFLADIGIPGGVFEKIGLSYHWPDPSQWIVELISGA